MEIYDYYLKKLTTQELGYRNGKLSTGAYFYISKQAVGKFFQELDKNKLNDSIILNFINCDFYLENLTATFVYHNDSHCKVDGTRDEYRIYLNRSLNPHDMYIRPNDIIIFKKLNDTSLIFKIIKCSDEKYHTFDNIIETSHIRGNHALLSSEKYQNFFFVNNY